MDIPAAHEALLRHTLQHHRISPQHHGLQPHRILPPRRLAARGAVRPAGTGKAPRKTHGAHKSFSCGPTNRPHTWSCSIGACGTLFKLWWQASQRYLRRRFTASPSGRSEPSQNPHNISKATTSERRIKLGLRLTHNSGQEGMGIHRATAEGRLRCCGTDSRPSRGTIKTACATAR
jgi:hypothetical protein